MIYSDIKIENDDMALDDVNAVIIEDRDVILQDLQHALRESGLLLLLIAERSPVQRRLLIQKVIALAEEDTRIVPGTVSMTPETDGWMLQGKTYEFGEVAVNVGS